MGSCRELVESAESSLRAVLHESLEDHSVQDLEGVLVELVEVAWRVSELARRLQRAAACRADIDGLRLDAHGAERFCSPTQALETAQADLSQGAAAAASAAEWLHEARQVTSTIGLVFDAVSGEEVEF